MHARTVLQVSNPCIKCSRSSCGDKNTTTKCDGQNDVQTRVKVGRKTTCLKLRVQNTCLSPHHGGGISLTLILFTFSLILLHSERPKLKRVFGHSGCKKTYIQVCLFTWKIADTEWAIVQYRVLINYLLYFIY